MTAPRQRCQARTRKGDRCRNPAGPDGLCALHRRQAERGAPEPQRVVPGAPEPDRVVPGEPEPDRVGPGAPEPDRVGPGEPDPHRVVPGPPTQGATQGAPDPHPAGGGAPEREGSPTPESGAAVVHTPPDDAANGAQPVDEPDLGPLEPVLAWAEEALEFLGRRVLGEYEVDEFGHDPDLVEHVLAPLLRPLYRHWWRVEARGLEHVPSSGPALVVGNHAGTLPFDALMVALALLDEHPAHRSLRMLAADLAFDLPVIAPLARKSGNTLACAEDATRLLEAGELVGVWPEGYKGLGKPYRERYQLQRFGRGGFVEIALRAGAPIVPVAVVGSEEIYPMLANLRRLARLLGFPYFPVTPTFPALGPLGAIPLPSKWVIEFCPPIETASLGPEAAVDPMTLFDLTDQVRDTIQRTVHRNLLGRRGVFG
jgi:1-acyl-sn-glycerol-3-phosphate acyltransferase